MVKFVNISSLRHYLSILLRNLMFYLNFAVCLYVWHFSMYDEDKAAVLSYIAVATTVLTIKSTFQTIKSTNALSIFFANVLSKTMIIAGICTVMFFQFWNTALYSICLGLMIQKLQHDMELRRLDLDLIVQALGDDILIDASDEPILFNPQNTIMHTQKVTQVVNFQKNEDDSLKQVEQNKKLMRDEYKKQIDGFTDQKEFVQKFCDNESKTLLNYICIKGKRKGNNTQEFKTKFPKIEHDMDNIEPRQNERGMHTKDFITSSEKTFKDLKQLDTVNNRKESTSAPENKTEVKLPHEQVDIEYKHKNDSLNIIQRCNFQSSFQCQNLYQQNQSEKEEKLHQDSDNEPKDDAYLQFQNNVNSRYLLGPISFDFSKINLPNNTTCDKINNASLVTDLEKSVIKETILTKEHKDESHFARMETTYDQNEKEICNHQMQGISEQVNVIDTTSRKVSKENVLSESLQSENHESSETSSSCMTLDSKPVILEVVRDAKKENENNEVLIKSPEDFSENYFKSISDVEGVVNRIDMSFIYSLGFNVSSAPDSF